MKNPRAAAIQALLRVEAGAHAQAAVAGVAGELAEPDRRLCADLVYGSLRMRHELRPALDAVLPNAVKLPPLMRLALELGVYSLLFQDRAPAYAVVNETVAIIKKKFGQRLANVANAALRRLARSGQAGQMPFAGQATLAPEIMELWRQAYGDESAQALATRSLRRPWSALRLNSRRPESAALAAALAQCEGCSPTGASAYAFPPGRLPRTILGRSLDYWLECGLVSRQAAASQVALVELGLVEGWQGKPVWDACAGFGGKTAFLLEQNLDVALASDVSLKRLGGLAGELRRLRLPMPGLILADAAQPPVAAWRGHILADAPCSGLGVLGRRPDLREHWQAQKLPGLERLQARILDGLAAALAPGNELAYVTCALNPAENEDQIEFFLRRHSDMELLRVWQTPHGHPWLEGMYGARLRKRIANA